MAAAKRKRCANCQQVKPITSFGVNRQMRDGLHYICKPCAAARTRAWRAANSAAAAEYARLYRQSHTKINGTPRPRNPSE